MDLPDPDWEAIAAVGTVAAVAAALILPFFVPWIRRPKLSTPQEGTVGNVVIDPRDALSSGADAFKCWLRIYVRNRGKDTAEDCVVLLTRFHSPEDGLRAPPLRELKWADIATDKVSIQPKVERLVDVVHFVSTTCGGEPVRGLKTGALALSKPDQESGPASPLWVDAVPGVYRLEIDIAARNARAQRYEVSFLLTDVEALPRIAQDLRGVHVRRVVKKRMVPPARPWYRRLSRSARR